MIVDVHGHITIPELAARFPMMPPSLLDVDRMLDDRSAAGVDLTIVGSPAGFGTLMRLAGHDNYAQSLDDLHRYHHGLAELVARHPDRLRAYAYVNPFGGDAALNAARTAVRDEGFVGLIANTSVKGRYLDAAAADGFFSLVAELDVPLLLHPPAEPVGSAALEDGRLMEQVGRFADVTVGLAAIVFSGRLERDPGLRLIGASGGGAIALLPERLDRAHQPRHWAEKGGPGGPDGPGARAVAYEDRLARPPSESVARLYVDTATPSHAALAANLAVLGPERILFGTDSPPLSVPLRDALQAIRDLPISPDDVALILGGNAARLFRLGVTADAA